MLQSQAFAACLDVHPTLAQNAAAAPAAADDDSTKNCFEVTKRRRCEEESEEKKWLRCTASLEETGAKPRTATKPRSPRSETTLVNRSSRLIESSSERCCFGSFGVSSRPIRDARTVITTLRPLLIVPQRLWKRSLAQPTIWRSVFRAHIILDSSILAPP